MTQAEIDVLAEREKQRAKWDSGHDDEHDDGQIAKAAGTLALDIDRPGSDWWGYALVRKHSGDRRKQLVIAAALLIAEVERIDRASAPKQDEPADSRRRCNRHDDCDVAEAFADAHGRPRPDHCHDDECPDCFGD